MQILTGNVKRWNWNTYAKIYVCYSAYSWVYFCVEVQIRCWSVVFILQYKFTAGNQIKRKTSFAESLCGWPFHWGVQLVCERWSPLKKKKKCLVFTFSFLFSHITGVTSLEVTRFDKVVTNSEFITFTYPLTARGVGAPWMIHNQFPQFFSLLPLPSGT